MRYMTSLHPLQREGVRNIERKGEESEVIFLECKMNMIVQTKHKRISKCIILMYRLLKKYQPNLKRERQRERE